MPITIDEFVDSLKSDLMPFRYEAPVEKRHFMFSYDMSINARREFTGDFRQFVVAILHAAGATEIKCYVATTLYFDANSRREKSSATLQNWKKLLAETFGSEFTLMLGMLRDYDNNTPVSVKIANRGLEAEFDSLKVEVIAKF